MENRDDQIGTLGEGMSMAYAAIQERLRKLPIPINLPDPGNSPEEMLAVLKAVERARTEVIQDAPIDDRCRAVIRWMLLDWQAAYELIGHILMNGPLSWRVDAAFAALHRIAAALETLQELDASDPEE